MDLDPSVERTHSETFDFADLRFIKSSRMSKRWLVFALRIKVRPAAVEFSAAGTTCSCARHRCPACKGRQTAALAKDVSAA